QLADVTADGLLIRETKFRKCRLVPLHETAQHAVNCYLAARARIRPVASEVLRGWQDLTRSGSASFTPTVATYEGAAMYRLADSCWSFCAASAPFPRDGHIQTGPLWGSSHETMRDS